MRLPRKILATVAVVLVASAPAVAHAQDAAVCKDGHDRAKVSRDGGKLVEARKLLLECSTASCSSLSLHNECVAWLAEVEARLGSLILSAEDEKGTDLVDVAVSIDGKEGPRKLDGRAHEIDPGEHMLVFQLADGRKTERRVVVRDGEKNKIVAVTIGAPGAPGAPGGAADTSSEQSGLSDAALAALQPKSTGASMGPLRLAGFITAGTGVVAVTVGAIFGVVASNQLSVHCEPSAKVCDPGAIDEAKSAATISTIGFVAGGLLLAGGLTLVFLGPKWDHSARAKTAPRVAVNGSGLSLQGVW